MPDLAHIFFNMFGVFMFGRILEQLWGSKKMLIFYTVTGLGAAFIHLTVNYFQMNHMLDLANAVSCSSQIIPLSMPIVNKYSHRTDEFDQIINFMQQWFYKPDDLSFIPQATEVMLPIIMYGNLRYPHRWCFRCCIRTADCFCHDVSRCGTHADLPSHTD